MNAVKKYSLIVSIFVLVYLIFVIAIAPANKILAKFDLPKGLEIRNISGSIWSGEAKLISYQQVSINDVEWSLSPLSLLLFNPSVDLTFGGSLQPGPRGSLELSNLTNDLTVNNANVAIAANDVLAYIPLPIDASAGGEINLDVPEFVLGKPICTVSAGTVTWQRAFVSAMKEDVDLGTLAATLGCEKGALTFEVNPENVLGLQFKGVVAARGKVSGQGYITPGNDFPANVRPLLGFIGKKDFQGRYKLKL
ncbi:type II secretion system protein N [Thalassomonas sp. M1454]|uniref:type II secretion system protein N n=1 Tax=Thalassomonas sp. M1454 TaxID=2594477 RepID=UPI00118135FA|nr:type II secretion system protein N [Thalassomonas sp. M1454]TRX57891.1 type II secretion system protein N [Thalassomonas sp. M1454]